jgi:uncharacterized protein (DUF58 family)
MSGAALSRAESLAAQLPPLLVAAERVANTVAQGVHGRRRVGQGDSFWQFRNAQQGDSARQIDWRQSARADRLYVRQTEREAAQTICLWRDPSPRMEWRSHLGGQTKAGRANLLLLATALLLMRAGELVRLAEPGLPEFAGRAGLLRLAAHLEALPAADALPDPALLPRHAKAVLIGDFLAPMEEIAPCLAGLAGRPAATHLVQVLDPAEQSLPYEGRVLFTPIQGGAQGGPQGGQGELVANVGELRSAYAARLAAQRAAIAGICAGFGFGFQIHLTAAPPATALMALAAALAPDVAARR